MTVETVGMDEEVAEILEVALEKEVDGEGEVE